MGNRHTVMSPSNDGSKRSKRDSSYSYSDDSLNKNIKRTRLQDDLGEANQRMQEFAHEKETSESLVENLNKEKDQLEEEIIALEESHTAEIESMNTDLAAAQKNIDEYTRRLQESEASVEILNKEKDQLTDTIIALETRMKNIVDEADKSKAESAKKIQSLEDQVSELSSLKESHAAGTESLSADLAAAEQKIDESAKEKDDETQVNNITAEGELEVEHSEPSRRNGSERKLLRKRVVGNKFNFVNTFGVNAKIGSKKGGTKLAVSFCNKCEKQITFDWGLANKQTVKTIDAGKCQCWESRVMKKLSEHMKENVERKSLMFREIFDALSKHRPKKECFELSKISDDEFNYFRTIWVAETVAVMETIYPTEHKTTNPSRKILHAKNDLDQATRPP